MHKFNQTALVVSLFALGLFVLPAATQAGGMRGGGGYHMMTSGMMSQFTPEEQKTVEELGQKYYGPMMDLRKRIFAKNAELNAVMAQEKFDPKKARELAKDVRMLQSKLQEQHMEMLIEMREKGISYYGTCMTGGRMGRHMMGGGMMGPGMMNYDMMDEGTTDTDKE